MAFADPQSITINAVAQSLARTGMSDGQGVFTKDDGSVSLKVSQSDNGKRARQAIRLDSKKVAPDPLNPTLSVRVSSSITLVVDTPALGYSLAEKKQLVDALVAYLAASSGAKVTQLLGGEI